MKSRFVKIKFTAIFLSLVYVIAEVTLSTVAFVCSPGWQDAGKSFWIFEDSGQTVHFDPIQGYRLTSRPARTARITNREIEYLGAYRGNQQGFPDQDDFTIHRPNNVSKRLLVFGDSFTAAPFLKRNWPDTIEHVLQADMRLLNCSIDGGGLANWWSVLANLLDRNEYQYDGIIFAVFDGDLARGFTIADHRGYDRHMFARLKSWDPKDFPSDLTQARAHLEPMAGHILGCEDFESALKNRRLRQTRPFYEHLYLAFNVCRSASHLFVPHQQRQPTQLHANFHSGRAAMVKDIRRRAKARGIHPLVVHIPTRDELVSRNQTLPAKRQAMIFAKRIDGIFIDGGKAFEGLSEAEIRRHWLPYDGHWAQAGSDRFARFMLEVLKKKS